MPLLKYDLHIHTPHSVCYVENMHPELNQRTTPADIVVAALAQGLDVLAITDHNSGEYVEQMREAARGTGLVILPGFEISARAGHVLGLFEVDTPVVVLREVLAGAGFTESEQGNGFARTAVWIDEVFRLIAEADGLAIAAHVDREPRGFLASEESFAAKRRIYYSPHLGALEITNPENRDRWGLGRDPRYPLARPCLQSSDAHAPAEIGRRPVLVETEGPTLAGLRAALADHLNRVQFLGDADGFLEA